MADSNALPSSLSTLTPTSSQERAPEGDEQHRSSQGSDGCILSQRSDLSDFASQILPRDEEGYYQRLAILKEDAEDEQKRAQSDDRDYTPSQASEERSSSPAPSSDEEGTPRAVSCASDAETDEDEEVVAAMEDEFSSPPPEDLYSMPAAITGEYLQQLYNRQHALEWKKVPDNIFDALNHLELKVPDGLTRRDVNVAWRIMKDYLKDRDPDHRSITPIPRRLLVHAAEMWPTYCEDSEM